MVGVMGFSLPFLCVVFGCYYGADLSEKNFLYMMMCFFLRAYFLRLEWQLINKIIFFVGDVCF